MNYRAIASSLFVVSIVLGASHAGAAAAMDAAAAKALAKESGCLRCHSETKTKVGPSYHTVAGKFKGAAGEKKIMEFITTGPKIKMMGSEAEHPAIKTQDKKELKNLVDWILSR